MFPVLRTVARWGESVLATDEDGGHYFEYGPRKTHSRSCLRCDQHHSLRSGSPRTPAPPQQTRVPSSVISQPKGRSPALFTLINLL